MSFLYLFSRSVLVTNIYCYIAITTTSRSQTAVTLKRFLLIPEKVFITFSTVIRALQASFSRVTRSKDAAMTSCTKFRCRYTHPPSPSLTTKKHTHFWQTFQQPHPFITATTCFAPAEHMICLYITFVTPLVFYFGSRASRAVEQAHACLAFASV